MKIKNSFLTAALGLASLVLTFILYQPAKNAPFIFDDNRIISENKLIKDIGTIGDLFLGKTISSSKIASAGMCRPLLMSTFALDYHLNGLNPAGYRVVNITLHIVNTILLVFLLITLGVKPLLSAMLGTIFLVHPINSETIIAISNRSDLMVALFMLAAFIFWKNKKYLLFTGAFIAALLTKESALCLPLLIGAWEICEKNKQKEKLPGWIATGAALIAYLVYRNSLFATTLSDPLRPLYDNILMQAAVTVTYFRVFFLFEPCNFFHYVPHLNSIFSAEAFCGMLFISAIIFLAFFLRTRNKTAAFAAAWILIALLPKFYSRLNFPAMEHHFYFPSIGIYLFAAAFLNKIEIKKMRVLFFGTISILGLLTFFRAAEFKDTLTFWSATVDRNPFDTYAHNELGIAYLEKNNTRPAQEEFKKALTMPGRAADHVIAAKMLAQIYIKDRQYLKAEKILNRLIALKKPPDGAFEIMGDLCAKTNDAPGAIIAWQKEIKLYPNRSEAYSHLGHYFLENNDLLAAKKYFSIAVNLDPDSYFAYYGAGEALYMENNRRSIEFYQQALRIKPDFSPAHLGLAQAYIKNNNPAGAIGELEPLKTDKNYTGIAYNDTAIAYTMLAVPDWAKAYENAIEAKKSGYPISETLVKMIMEKLKINATR